MGDADALPNAQATRGRILRAVLEQAAETGMRKLSMDEVAVRAGVARATLYLHFPGRKALIDTAVRHEIERLFAHLRAVIATQETLDDRVVETFAAAHHWLREHPILTTILRINPSILLPYVLGDAVAIGIGRAFVVEALVDEPLAGPIGADELAEHLIRQIHSLILAPAGVFVLDDQDAARDYARRFLLPVARAARDRTA